MPDLRAALRDALARFDATAQTVTDDQWDAPTPCAEWSVRDLLNHVTAEVLWSPHLLAGETLEQVGDRYDGDVLGDDPRAAWEEACRRQRAALAEPAALEGTAHTSMGEIPAAEYGMQQLTDLVVHGWDLARGIGADDAIDPEVAGMLYEHAQGYGDGLAASGLFAPPVDVPEGAGAAEKLLALLGRQP
jgi:uncharacterized protein (TIGR03086 family)